MAAATTAALIGISALMAGATVVEGQKARKQALDQAEDQEIANSKQMQKLEDQKVEGKAVEDAKKARARAVAEQRKASGAGRDGTVLGSDGSAAGSATPIKTLLGQ